MRRAAQALLWALAAAFVVPRLVLSACGTDFGPDGSYYTDIALNVRDGRGLTSDVSVFHQGFPYFPHPTPVYPLWPLLYGTVARLAPVEVVGVWLPTALYLVALGLAYLLGRRLGPRPLIAGLPLHGGHVFALLFAINTKLSKTTAAPYTEGLAFVLLLACLLRSEALFARLSSGAPLQRALLAGLEMGVWLMVLFLTRSQFIVVGLALAAAVGLTLVPRLAHRQLASVKPSVQRLGVFLLGVALPCVVLWNLFARWWLATYLPEPSLRTYLRFDTARVNDLLSEVPVMYQPHGLLDRLGGLALGLGASMSPDGESSSYVTLHHAAAYLMPAALLLLLAQRRRWPALWRLLRGPAGPFVAFAHLAALALAASLHTVHKVYGIPWVFGGRQAIPSVLLVGLCALYLLKASPRRSPRWGSWHAHAAAVFLLSAAAYEGWVEQVNAADFACDDPQTGTRLTEHRPELRQWLQAERDRLGGLTVAAERPEAQRLSWRTPGVGFHWMTETTSLRDLEVMVEQLGVQYVMAFDLGNDQITRQEGFSERFVLAALFREGGAREDGPKKNARAARVFAPRCAHFPVPTCLYAPLVSP
jgi:hypothetical protein